MQNPPRDGSLSHDGALAGSPYPPIGDYAFLSDCEVSALIAPSGSVEWMCLPRMDGPSIFGAMLDRVLPEVDALRRDQSWRTLLLVLHGGVNRAILSYLLSGERAMLGGFEQSPACINILDVGVEHRDVILRATNLSPTDWLQHDTRSSTMEVLFGEYAAFHGQLK